MHDQKTSVVTGGSKGIGLGVVGMLVRKGYRVIASYARDQEAAERAKKELGGMVEFVKADHAIRQDTYRFIERVKNFSPKVDCIVCNAGHSVRKNFEETEDKDWDDIFEVSLNSHLIIIRELFSIISNGGRIIFTGSSMGEWPHATVLGYGVSKQSVHALAKNLVKVFEGKRVTVNAVSPGFVDTDWHRQKPEAVKESILGKIAAHRFAEIDEIVRAYEFCIDNEFVNGSVVEVNGGYNYK